MKDARFKTVSTGVENSYIHVFIKRAAFESLGLQNINEEYFSKLRLHPVGHGSSSPYVTYCPLQQYKEVTSSEAVGKGKTVKTCKHSSIPRKKLLCESFSVQTEE